ncbi:Xylose isomerase-like TIM barrel [Pirellulimonas nuda]|uniref:Xylose isomerase-like TIM barrel n=1 Tax=Pirellulimonas nuda TaxID=2528009 RepID=A0A518D857_9BACT|nr:sugar phosphate isomerase/epimerase family protein [Pirellulimonas nuda]QDU87648.1 Xylose isomerase-like TIM barrel [Pirellulimonas nuda]
MPDAPQIIISGIADEAAPHRTALEQFAALSALGLQYYTIRNIEVGTGVKNVMDLSKADITKVRHLEDEFGMNVASIGSPIGKVKLINKDDGTKARFVPFKKYLEKDVKKACELAHAFETKLIRGFSFYPPRGADPYEHLPQAVDQLGQIAEACHRSDLTFGLEVEANLVGSTGQLMAELHRQVGHPAMVTVFDGGNLISQGFSTTECYEQYLAMKPSLGWIHVKDYRNPNPQLSTQEDGSKKVREVDEEALKHFVPADRGDSGYDLILRDFKEMVPKLARKLKRRGIPGVFVELEPHLKAGGQYGGFSGADGMGVALRSLCKVLDYVGLDYHLRDFDDVCVARGV